MGIPLVHDLPGVGQNLRSHPGVGVVLRVKDDSPMDPLAPRFQTGLRFTAQGSDDRNDLMITPWSFSTTVPFGGDPMEAEGIGFACGLYLAVGAGELRLQSTDPFVQPHIDYRYLEDPWDRQRLRDCVRTCIRLVAHEAYRDIVAHRISPTDEALASDDALDDWIRNTVRSPYHISGTCKMGPSSDFMAVVDQYGRVHGIERLRVVDASIMPDVVRTPTNASTIMIGERASDLIKEQLSARQVGR